MLAWRVALLMVAVAVSATIANAGEAAHEPGSSEPIAAGSLHAPPKSLQAWRDAKLGIFIHFGPWSQTGNGIIWPIGLTRSPAERARYFDLYRTFNPIHFDANQWARTARQSGARYVVFTAKHHDGFCNFDTALTDFRITNPECPYSSAAHPDLTGDLMRAVRDQGLLAGIYYSHVDWHHPDGGWFPRGQLDETFVSKHPDRWRRFVAYERGQVRELLTNYGRIDIFWFDIFWPKSGRADAVPMLRMMRRLQPGIVINNRGTGKFADFTTPEQGVPNPVPHGPWESCITISQGNGFWYKGPHAAYKSAADLVRLLADVVSKGGNLLLNIGPRPDGSLVPEETARLHELGQWLSRNGAAIYGTRRSPLKGVPAWGRVTQKGSRLFLIVFDWPKAGTPLHVELAQPVASAFLLGGSKPVRFRRTADGSGIDLSLPSQPPDSPASVIVLELSGNAR